MESAFGIDHGYEEIEKAFGVGAAGGMLRKVGLGIGTSARSGAASSGGMAGRNLASGGGARKLLGQGQIKMGQGLKRVSNFAMQRPVLAGGLAAGGTAAGVGGAGGALTNRRRY